MPFYRVVAEVPNSTFVEAEETRWGGPGGITTVGYAATDGTMQVTGWEANRHNDKSCSFTLTDDEVLRCLPSSSASSYYGDASCEKQLGEVISVVRPTT